MAELPKYWIVCGIILLLVPSTLASPVLPNKVHRTINGKDIQCIPVKCLEDQYFLSCTENGTYDTCHGCKPDTINKSPINSKDWPYSNDDAVCITPDCSCTPESKPVNDSCKYTGIKVCECDLANDQYGHDYFKCSKFTGTCLAGTELKHSGGCSPCKDGYFKKNDGPGLCYPKTKCLGPYLEIDNPGNKTHDARCRSKIPNNPEPEPDSTKPPIPDKGKSTEITKHVETNSTLVTTTPKYPDDNQNSATYIIVGTIIGIVGAVIVVFIVCVCCCKKKRSNRQKKSPKTNGYIPMSIVSNGNAPCTKSHDTNGGSLYVNLPDQASTSLSAPFESPERSESLSVDDENAHSSETNLKSTTGDNSETFSKSTANDNIETFKTNNGETKVKTNLTSAAEDRNVNFNHCNSETDLKTLATEKSGGCNEKQSCGSKRCNDQIIADRKEDLNVKDNETQTSLKSPQTSYRASGGGSFAFKSFGFPSPDLSCSNSKGDYSGSSDLKNQHGKDLLQPSDNKPINIVKPIVKKPIIGNNAEQETDSSTQRTRLLLTAADTSRSLPIEGDTGTQHSTTTGTVPIDSLPSASIMEPINQEFPTLATEGSVESQDLDPHY